MTVSPRVRRWSRRLLWAVAWTAGGTLLVIVIAIIASREVRFVLRAAYEEARILLARQSIERLLAEPELAAARRERFQLVLEARAYGRDSLGLEAGDTYTTFADVGRDTLLLVLTAAPWDALEPYTWWYPIVGTVPYKGFFDFDDGRSSAQQLAAEGYDVYLRPSAAFSTLGWFNDPLLSTALDRGPEMLVELVLHEIAHNTLYVSSATPFNESFALFVGYRGAAAFFRSRGDASSSARVGAIWRDQRRLSEFYASLHAELTDVYDAAVSDDSLRAWRRAAYDGARERLQAQLDGQLEVFDGRRLAARPLNNASLLASRIYLTDVEVFDRVLEHFGGDLRASIAAIREAMEARGDRPPFDVLRELLVS
jgi:predicted aminopeptidase